MKKGKKIFLISLSSFLGLILAFILFAFVNSKGRNNVYVVSKIENTTGYVQAHSKALYDSNGDELILRGTNAGGLFCTEGWLEPYYVPLEYKKSMGWYDESSKGKSDVNALSEEQFRYALIHNENLDVDDDDDIDALMATFYQNWFTKDDMKNIADLGLNCLRVPFYWKNILNTDYSRKEEDEAFKYLDDIVSWGIEYGVYIILDLHGCPESQNGYEHGGALAFDKYDSSTIGLWDDDAAVNAVCDLWAFISEHYNKDEYKNLGKQIAAFDIMNEPRSEKFKTDKTCHEVFDKVYDSIREIDTNHVIMMEGCWDFSTLPNPEKYGWTNVCYEYHWYNWYTSILPYELFYWYQDLSNVCRDYDVPVFIGEFTFFEDEEAWLQGLELFENRHYSWTMWTYKKNIDGDYNDSWGLYNLDTKSDGTTCKRVDVTTCTKDELLNCFRNCKTKSNANCKSSETCNYITKFLNGLK